MGDIARLAGVAIMLCIGTAPSYAASPDILILSQGSLVQEIAGALAPPTIELSSGVSLSIVDVYYCGANASTGSMLLLLGPQTKYPKQQILARKDCGQPLSGLLANQEDNPNVLGAAQGLITSSPTNLTVSIASAAVKAGSALSNDTAALQAYSKAFPIQPIVINTDFIRESMSVVLHFEQATIAVGLFDQGAQPSDGWDQVQTPSPIGNRFHNVDILLAHSFVQSELQKYQSQIQFQNADPHILISDFTYAGEVNKVTISADVHSFDVNDDATVYLVLSGPDLMVSQVQVPPRVEQCDHLNFIQKPVCSLHNIGHATYANSISNVLNNDLNGKYLRPSNVTKPMELKAFNQTLSFRTAINQTFSTADYLILSGGAILEPKN